mmetsp:Transcript_13274/g.20129  ORF Transcript_13274/g.20129 Transcript_13274/m.20129 type:complete len:231 (+) Transcript_13274:87-779(+)
MSLNFVSTTVLSSTDGVSHNTETRLEGSEAASTQSEGFKPLYEQLRKNAQEEQDKYDEVTKAMRGAQALDEEDVAHLQGIEDERAERLRQQALKEKEEVESYRLAKLDYQEASRSKQQEEEEELNNLIRQESEKKINEAKEGKSALAQLKPKIKVTKKRRRTDGKSAKGTAKKSNKIEADAKEKEDAKKEGSKADDKEEATSSRKDSSDKGAITGLGGLLGSYGSDSDSD